MQDDFWIHRRLKSIFGVSENLFAPIRLQKYKNWGSIKSNERGVRKRHNRNIYTLDHRALLPWDNCYQNIIKQISYNIELLWRWNKITSLEYTNLFHLCERWNYQRIIYHENKGSQDRISKISRGWFP